MRQIISLLLIAVVFSIPTFAQKSYSPKPKDRSLLWEISGNGLPQSSYLYGTIHMIGADDFFLTEKTKESFRKAGRLALEINMEDMTDMSKLMPLLSSGGIFMKNDTTLKDLLSEKDYKTVYTHFENMGMPMSFMEKIKPMFLSAMGNEEMLSMNGSGNIKSYEMEFVEMAKAQEKELDGLETAEYQLSVFDSIPYQVQAKMLMQSITAEDGKTEGEEQFNELVELYKKRDLYGLQEMLNKADSGIEGYENVLLINRNKNWIPVMEELMSREVVFFAVGAGHLPGEEGVIALLRKKGYKVEPIKEKL